ncbi:L-rhamnulose 1-phosphate aldolase [Pelosinus fermentans]|uniref:Rhamnulose-1-phosphate aldolase n=1 Tax=Pelosinus fermentans B4 TaxID=1149862 RepID=I8RJF0_9FIRM|nr:MULTISPECIES: rhamnulose-1-phosphate aldolase [Pelosinus]EIW20148.1 rhamnulose-1-phosphate aldolase [Pelosinus fermentans B4]OAM93046.1 Rhamnulose-1-phosphate aldolase [Pelosinus fermentans DSM 17108]SDQ65183.1 L-rhamnulose 1-phosphate aldolase [Pelosinus fermentans]
MSFMIEHEIPFVREMMEVTRNLWEMGWGERNGGNISYLLREDIVKQHMNVLDIKRSVALPFPVPELAGKYFIVTGTGKYFKNVVMNPEENLGVLRVNRDGNGIEILWGYKDGGLPTSELAAHFMSHIERLKKDENHRVIMHTHATNVLAMTFVHDLDEKKITKTLWQMCTECLIVFPDGIGVIPWIVPGTNEIGKSTAQKMQDFRLVIWPQHGIFGAGRTMDETFGLIETVEKAAQIYMLISSHQGGVQQSLTDQELIDLAKEFGVKPAAGVLDIR